MPESEILKRLIALSKTPGSGFVGVWCDRGQIKLKRKLWDPVEEFERVTWVEAEQIVREGRIYEV